MITGVLVGVGILLAWLIFEIKQKKRRRDNLLKNMRLEIEHFNMSMRKLNEQTENIIPIKKRQG
jgi:hypothetical protein